MNSTLSNFFTAREDLTQRVIAEANSRGVPAEDLMNQIVENGLAYLPTPSTEGETIPVGGTIADALAGHLGTVASGRGDLSQKTGRRFGELMQEKRKAGRL